MINSKDLCIGNVVWWLNTEDDKYETLIIDSLAFDMVEEEDESHIPIPINIKILEYLGWKKRSENDFQIIYSYGYVNVYYSKEHKAVFVYIEEHVEPAFSREIKYFYELENLYYFTTGEHLEVDLDLLEYDKIKELL
jgi:hypothetical protein